MVGLRLAQLGTQPKHLLWHRVTAQPWVAARKNTIMLIMKRDVKPLTAAVFAVLFTILAGEWGRSTRSPLFLIIHPPARRC